MQNVFFRPADGTETVAVPQEDGTYRLYGYKWFSSATDSDITFTLARVVNEAGETIQVCDILSPMFLFTLKPIKDYIPPGAVFVLRWQFSPEQMKSTYKTNDSTYILYGFGIKMRNVLGLVSRLCKCFLQN